MELKVNDLDRVIAEFNTKFKLFSDGRYASFDFCYNYFRRTENLTDDIEKSCLVLGFYLASWGMYRGSSFLLKEKNARHFIPIIKYISTLDKSLWKIDVDNYNSENIKIIGDVYEAIRKKLVPNKNAHLTLVTKTLLGVFGFTPAFDNFFCDTFRNLSNEQCGFRVLNINSLSFIKKFYEANIDSIDKLSTQNCTIDFKNGQKTDINYPKAKIIDMYGFMKEYLRREAQKNISSIKK